MTREIALHCMKSYSELFSDLCELCPIYGQTGSDHCFEDALQYVIGMLEQEPVLDKIRAEIEQLPTNTRVNWDGCCPDIDYPEIEYVDVTKNELLSIIDKYKAKPEDKE